jgi:hypothetical protein
VTNILNAIEEWDPDEAQMRLMLTGILLKCC